MKSSTKSTDTREQLRELMSRHTAASSPRPVLAAPPPPTAPVLPKTRPAAAPKVAPKDNRCTVRLVGSELDRVDQISLWTHERLRTRIAISDVLRIGLLRITEQAPIAAAELQKLRQSDGSLNWDRRTVCLTAAEFDNVDQVILGTHRLMRKRITVTDVVRVGLSRITEIAPVTERELDRIGAGRRKPAPIVVIG